MIRLFHRFCEYKGREKDAAMSVIDDLRDSRDSVGTPNGLDCPITTKRATQVSRHEQFFVQLIRPSGELGYNMNVGNVKDLFKVYCTALTTAPIHWVFGTIAWLTAACLTSWTKACQHLHCGRTGRTVIKLWYTHTHLQAYSVIYSQ
jgi:hypothetical protein